VYWSPCYTYQVWASLITTTLRTPRFALRRGRILVRRRHGFPAVAPLGLNGFSAVLFFCKQSVVISGLLSCFVVSSLAGLPFLLPGFTAIGQRAFPRDLRTMATQRHSFLSLTSP
jgi:hypothetical protein